MSKNRYKESRFFVVAGLLGLSAGSVLLLVRKLFAVPELWSNISTFAGGGIVLFSNSCIIYGLLLFVGNQDG